MKVTYWSDYACPFCYIGKTNLKKAAQELGLDLDFELKAFELDPTASNEWTENTVDRFAKKYRLSNEEALDKVNSISIMAKDSGIDIDYSKAKYTNTFKAHKLTKLARDLGKEEELADKLYEAYFKNQKELANVETLIEIAESVGIDRKQVEEALDSDNYSTEVLIDEQIAHENGISAVPFFIINEEIAVPGALGKEQFKEVLENITD